MPAVATTVLTGIELLSTLKKAIDGDADSQLSLAKEGIDIGNTAVNAIREKTFKDKLYAVLNGLNEKGTLSREIGKKLAKSSYGPKYGYALLHYIDDYETPSKGTWMAYLLDSVSKNFISPDECFAYCKLVDDLSLAALTFLRDNIQKQVVTSNERNELVISELRHAGMLYETNTDGLAFERIAFVLDKYAMSYNTEGKYGYRSKYEGIPEIKDFPRQSASISIEQGEPYKDTKSFKIIPDEE